MKKFTKIYIKSEGETYYIGERGVMLKSSEVDDIIDAMVNGYVTYIEVNVMSKFSKRKVTLPRSVLMSATYWNNNVVNDIA